MISPAGQDENEQSGPYDPLYDASGILWPSRPGRMVCRAIESTASGHCLDAGCGDGKNLLFLQEHGWIVDGIDSSVLAINACKRRLGTAHQKPRGRLITESIVHAKIGADVYDMVVAYGLYHCLSDDEVVKTHHKLTSALKPGGLFVFAAFNSELPLPENHHTGRLFLRPKDFITAALSDWRCISIEHGEIEEEHLPLVGKHRHALTWGIFEKR